MRIREEEAQKNLQQEDDISSEDDEEFLKSLGFKDPFHKNLLSKSNSQMITQDTESKNKNENHG